jgi:hypothetical protein
MNKENVWNVANRSGAVPTKSFAAMPAVMPTTIKN